MKTTQQCFLELSYTVTWKPWKVFGMLELKSEMLYYRGAVWQSMAWSDDFNGWKFDKQGFPGGTMLKHPPANAGGARYAGSIPGSGRSPGVDNGNPQQHFCLENSMDRGPWQATVHGISKSQTWLSMHTCTHTHTHTHTHNLKSTFTNQVGKIQSVPSTWSLRWLCSLSPILLFTKNPMA